MGVVYT